ncbi:MAG: hypothetical protein R3E66_06955 [bacterium]
MAVSTTETTAPSVVVAVPEPAKPGPPATYIEAESDAAKLAQRVIELDFSMPRDPEGVMAILGVKMPTLPYGYQSSRVETEVDTADGKITVTAVMQQGTWEQPKGNSAPRFEPAVVEAIELRGPNGLQLELPKDAEPMSFDATGVREFMVWGKYGYFEQGTADHGWMVARYNNKRGPFHRSAAEITALEDALIRMTSALEAGETDLQGLAAREFSKQNVSAENTYHFGAGSITVEPSDDLSGRLGWTHSVEAVYKLDVAMITISFAHDAGQMVNRIELDGLTVYPGGYYIRQPDSREADSSAPEAFLVVVGGRHARPETQRNGQSYSALIFARRPAMHRRHKI